MLLQLWLRLCAACVYVWWPVFEREATFTHLVLSVTGRLASELSNRTATCMFRVARTCTCLYFYPAWLYHRKSCYLVCRDSLFIFRSKVLWQVHVVSASIDVELIQSCINYQSCINLLLWCVMVFLACCVYTALVDVYSLNRNGPQGCVVPITSFYGVLSMRLLEKLLNNERACCQATLDLLWSLRTIVTTM